MGKSTAAKEREIRSILQTQILDYDDLKATAELIYDAGFDAGRSSRISDEAVVSANPMCECGHTLADHQESAIGKPCMFWKDGTTRDEMIRCPCDTFRPITQPRPLTDEATREAVERLETYLEKREQDYQHRFGVFERSALRTLIDAVQSDWIEIRTDDDLPKALDKYLWKLRGESDLYQLQNFGLEMFEENGRKAWAKLYSHWKRITPPTKEQP